MHESAEKMVPTHRCEVTAADLSNAITDLNAIGEYDPDVATVVLAPKGASASLVIWNLMPGQENDYHMQPETEHYQYVIEGELEWTLADREPQIVRPGQIVIVPPGVPHGIRNLSSTPARYASLNSISKYEKILCERPNRG